MIIYKIVNTVNGKVYIGQTSQLLQHRINQHKNRARKYPNRPLYADILKYGFDAFTIEVLDEIDDKRRADDLERYYMNFYNSIEAGYNVSYLDNNMNKVEIYLKHKNSMKSKDVRDKISNSLKQYRAQNEFTIEHRQNLSKAMLGNHNFGDSDTRSVGCYCITENGKRYNFHNYLQASEWWHKQYNPFNLQKYNYSTYRRKIVDMIKFKKCDFGRGKNKIIVTTPRWFNT